MSSSHAHTASAAFGHDYHSPVMPSEVMRALAIDPWLWEQQSAPRRFLDCNLGAGGHSLAILSSSTAPVSVRALDCDIQAIRVASERLSAFSNFCPIHRNFGDLPEYSPKNPDSDLEEPFDGILMDLGVSSAQLNQPERGFSFRFDEPLDMRMDQRESKSAADILAEESEESIRRILFEYGEEPKARALARAIVQRRVSSPIQTTGQLADLVRGFYKGPSHKNPATRTFQALRIAVNGELEHLKTALSNLFSWLKPSGRWVVLTYHSLEDRLVKQFFHSLLGKCRCPRDFPTCTCGCRPLARLSPLNGERASPAELEQNPRARSATLRACIKL